MGEENTQRILYADFLRILATFAVIVIHICAASITNCQLFFSYKWVVINIFDSLCRWAVPIFFMISGMFFLDKNREMDFTCLKKYILRVFIALCFYGFLYHFVFYVLSIVSGKEIFTMQSFFYCILNFIKKLVTGHVQYHLWFLYTIIGLYILIPILKLYTNSATKNDLLYMLIIYFIFGCTNTLCNKINEAFNVSIQLGFKIPELYGWSGYFILGYYLSHFDLKSVSKKVFYCLGFISFIITPLFTLILSYQLSKFCDIFYSYMAPNIVLESIFVFLLVQTNFSQDFKFKKELISSSKMTFGIYLCHDFFNLFFIHIGFTVEKFNPFFLIPIRTLITFLFCYLISYIISFMPHLKKYLL